MRRIEVEEYYVPETTEKTTERSPLLPTDEFDVKLRDLTGHTNGATTEPALLQSADEYGNVTSFMVQTVKWGQGTSVFITQVSAKGSARYVLPPSVVKTLLRQQDQVTTMVRRAHGKALAEAQRKAGVVRTFTPEQRRKALATRKAKAKVRAARRAKKEAR